jgi:hypothetical protein
MSRDNRFILELENDILFTYIFFDTNNIIYLLLKLSKRRLYYLCVFEWLPDLDFCNCVKKSTFTNMWIWNAVYESVLIKLFFETFICLT